MHEVTLDLETQNAFFDVGGSISKLLISLVGIHSTKHGLLSFEENELDKLWPILEDADLIIGFNTRHFDYNVLASYYRGQVHKLPTLDIMDSVTAGLGHRQKLNDIATQTLGKQKSGDGLQAIELFKNGEMEKLKSYCLDDVLITREIYDHGVKHGKILATSGGRVKDILVDWATPREKVANNLTLPF